MFCSSSHNFLNLQRERSKVSFKDAFSTREAKMGMFLALSVMLFQQLSGCNAVIFYSSQIFDVSLWNISLTDV